MTCACHGGMLPNYVSYVLNKGQVKLSPKDLAMRFRCDVTDAYCEGAWEKECYSKCQYFATGLWRTLSYIYVCMYILYL